MAASGNGKGGRSVTSTASYQILFQATSDGGSDGGAVRGYQVKPAGEDAVVEITYDSGEVREFNAPIGDWTPSVTTLGSKILKVRAKGETGNATAIYGNVLVP